MIITPGFLLHYDQDMKGSGCTVAYYPKGPCSQIVYTLGPKYLYGDYFKAKVYLFGYMDP